MALAIIRPTIARALYTLEMSYFLSNEGYILLTCFSIYHFRTTFVCDIVPLILSLLYFWRVAKVLNV